MKPSFVRAGQAGKFISTAEFASLAEALKSDDSYLPIDSVDYGNDFKIQLGQSRVAPETLLGVKHRSLCFLSTLCEQLVERLPANIELYENLAFSSPDECLKSSQPAFCKLPISLARKYFHLILLFLSSFKSWLCFFSFFYSAPHKQRKTST